MESLYLITTQEKSVSIYFNPAPKYKVDFTARFLGRITPQRVIQSRETAANFLLWIPWKTPPQKTRL